MGDKTLTGRDEAIALIREQHSLWQRKQADSHAQPL
jgi:hypothetical protein